MKYRAEIDIMPVKEALDPNGKAVKLGLASMGFSAVQRVRIGKHLELELDAQSREEASAQIESACKKLLANLIMEDYSYTIHEA